MYFTLAWNSFFENDIFPCTKAELIEYLERSGAPMALIDNIQELEDDGEYIESIYDIWPDIPVTNDDFGWEEDEY
ncbi:MAG: DUF2795 domain-containing protein [Bacteroidales bacterium]|uniref:DUF2795 domain-containing protein n=1 Tax=Sodaliphilus sp. TaxID=2815818 RepID=UPI001B3DE4C9|nr:DUF2795 domain-containing protein [Candidatus Sodaliphilus limicaballi]